MAARSLSSTRRPRASPGSRGRPPPPPRWARPPWPAWACARARARGQDPWSAPPTAAPAT
eukprot:2701246-Prymnesium_polylepis.1